MQKVDINSSLLVDIHIKRGVRDFFKLCPAEQDENYQR